MLKHCHVPVSIAKYVMFTISEHEYMLIVSIISLLLPTYVAAEVLRGGFFPGTGPIFLDQLNCNGLESSLLDCSSRLQLGLYTCDHSQDIGVQCTGMCMLLSRISTTVTAIVCVCEYVPTILICEHVHALIKPVWTFKQNRSIRVLQYRAPTALLCLIKACVFIMVSRFCRNSNVYP